MARYKTKPMTERQFKHIQATYFGTYTLQTDDDKFGTLSAIEGYDDYLEQCKHTELRKGAGDDNG